MKKLLLTLSALALTSLPAPLSAQSAGKTVCEGYCLVLGTACYVVGSVFVGKDKCDSMYEGCVDGCKINSLPESEE